MLFTIRRRSQGSRKKGIIVQARTAFPSTWGAFRYFLNDFRLVTMVRIWCTRSLGRLNLLDFLLRYSALGGGHP